MKRLIAALLAIVVTVPALAQQAQREITNITGDVFMFRNMFHNSLLVVTEAGTVRVDPINAEAGTWLVAALADMGAPPVSHLIWSHSHGDHGSGGEVHDGAELIAHEAAPADIAGVTPTRRVGDNTVLEIGGKTLELTNLGSGHDNHMLAVVVRPENVAFIVDVASNKRLPFRNMRGANLDDWIGQVETAIALDFEHFAPGHGGVGGPSDLADHLTYLQDLRAGVLAGLQAGKSVDQIKEELTLDAYAGWQAYDDWRGLNIEGMADYLQREGLVN